MRAWTGLVWALWLVACTSREQLGTSAMGILSHGVINDPANKSLRFDLLKFGLQHFCAEMQRRGVALKMRDGDPTIGRFFATSCQSQILDENGRQSIVIRYAGLGYGWTNVTQRVGFESQGLIEYAPDFQMHRDAMYVYFRPRNVDSTSFRTTLVESAVASTGIALTGTQPDQLGQQIVSSQLRRGFTVIRYDRQGALDFAMGMLPLGLRPFRPFQVVTSERVVLDNDRTELHAGQQDYIGGFTVEDSDQALFVTATLDGAPAADLFLLTKPAGDGLLQQYVRHAGPASFHSAPYAATLRAGQTLTQFIPVPKGTYYFLIDHSHAVGQAQPPSTAFDDRAARVDYLIQVGDRP